MRILITGPTSFSGAFIIEALAKAGHDVVTTFTQSLDAYTGIRRLRADKVLQHATAHMEVSFGDDRFLSLLGQESFDVFCHHGAWTHDYNAIDYDFESAFATNTRSMNRVCEALSKNGCQKIIVSGSIFEEAEPIFSPYGLMKKMTFDTTEFYGTHFGMQVSKFVIPNPFGPLDNPKFISMLLKAWQQGKTPSVQLFPYIRDNIPIDLLALGFADWVERCPATVGRSIYRPSGYVSTMAEFVRRLQRECRQRTGWACDVRFTKQTDFAQPLRLVNDVPLMPLFSAWDEQAFWDRLVGG